MEKEGNKRVHKKIVRHFLIFRYPKLEFLLLSILIAYFIFSQTAFAEKISSLGRYNYIGIFIAGILYSFGFSGPFAVGFFTSVENLNIFLASIIGGIGSLLTDILIFTVIRFSFMDEFNRIKKTKPFLLAERMMEKDLSMKSRRILLYVISCAIIASPLPDEIGVTMLSGLTNMKLRTLMIISIILSTFGVFIWLLIGGKSVWGF